MIKALLIGLNENIEEEVHLVINGVPIIGFAQTYAYRMEIGKIYPVKLSLLIYDKEDNYEEVDIELQTEKRYDIELIDPRGFDYQLYGKLEKDVLNLGKFDIQDDQLLLFPEFDGKFIRVAARINVEFV